uniref:helix-turn-helix domain-containing protein n=1 Tax=Eubacterium cellulosolvens TaxID=29322 RepID=UPI0004807DC0|nr:helix-turn-helix transcriptional regulator [[Eubacterium] cellulosolvens]
MTNKVFGTRIKELSMQKLANEMGVSTSRVSIWENTGYVPNMNVLADLAKYFNVTTDYLLGNDSSEERSVETDRLSSIQRNLEKLSEGDLQKVEEILQMEFTDVFVS